MALIYNPFDVFAVQRNATSSSFIETILRSTPNSVIMFDSASVITTLSTKSLADSMITASLSMGSASYAVSASYASNAPNAVSSSHALRSDLAISSSYAVSASYTMGSASYAISASYALNTPGAVSSSHALSADSAFSAISSSYAVSASYETNYETSSSFAESASIAGKANSVEFSNAINNSVPQWQNGLLTTSSAISIDSNRYVYINSESLSAYDITTRPVLTINNQGDADDSNYLAVAIVGNIDNYHEVVVWNQHSGSGASVDIIAANDNISTAPTPYIDVGINSTTYEDGAYTIQTASSAYIYNEGGDLAIGTRTAGTIMKLHAGGTMASNEIARVTEDGFFATGSITTAVSSSWASSSISSSYAESASYTPGSISSSHALRADVADSISFTPSLASSSLFSVSSSWASSSINSISSLFAISSSWASSSISSLFAVSSSQASSSISSSLAQSANYLVPGASFYQVSGSGLTPSFIESYEIINGLTQSLDYRPQHKEGRMFYNQEFDCWDYYTWQDGFRVHLGREVAWQCYNPTAATLPRGAAIYISSSTDGVHPDVFLAVADGTNTKSDVVGLVRNAIPSASYGYIIQNGAMYNVNMSAFNLSDPLYLSPTTPGGLTNVEPGQPYESVRVGNCLYNGSLGSIIISPVFKVPPTYAYAGITSNITVTNLDDGTVGVSSGSVNLYNNSTGFGLVSAWPLLATTLSLVTGSTNYIVAEISQSAAVYTLTTDETYANGINIVRVSTIDIYTGDPAGSEWDVHGFDVGIVGLALANRINNKDIRLYGYQRESGLTLFVTGSSGSFGITAGNVWYGPNVTAVPIFDTTLAGHYVYHFETTMSNGTSSWNRHTSSYFVSGEYNSGSYGLTPCAPGSWSVNFVYRLMGTTDEAALIVGENQFSTELEASNNGTLPANLPSTVRDMGLLVGKLMVQSGSFSPTIESAFESIFVPAVVTAHGDLLGLQGGQGGEYYHMTLADYTGTGTGEMVRATNPTMSNIMHVGVTPYHIPYWTLGNTLKMTGSIQVSPDGESVMINSASFPDPLNHEALLVKQVDSSSVNLIGAYATVDNFSQIYNQNLSNGSSASTDIVATANVGSQDANFIDVGIANSKYTGSTWPWTKALDGYLLMDGGDLWLALNTDHKLLFAFNNVAATSYADKTGFYLSGSFFGTSSFSNSSSFASTAGALNYTVEFATNATSASWASASLSASWVANLYPQTEQISASWASASLSASWVANLYPQTEQISASWSSASLSASWVADLYPQTEQISASWASASLSASWVPDLYPQTEQVSASWSSASLSASWVPDLYPQTAQVSASWASQSLSASWAPYIDTGTTLYTGSTYEITSSRAVTASYSIGVPTIKTGVISGSSFTNNPKTYTVTFTSSYINNLYTIAIVGEALRTWTVQTKSPEGFTINSNSNTTPAGMVFWQTIYQGEYYS